MNKRIIYITFPIIVILAVYFLGPAPAKPKFSSDFPTVPTAAAELDQYISSKEKEHKLKPDNEARIIWADSTKKKTAYSVIYLHGFSASQEEGDPVHTDFAKAFGCNLYLARMADHGIDTTEQLLTFTPDRLWQSAKEALAIGKAIGDKVIIMSTSTGGTMALMLAAQYPDDVFALINMSPNIAINNGTAWLFNNPWGLQIMHKATGGEYRSFPPNPKEDQYWNNPYRLEAVTQLEELVEDKMNKETFQKVKCPSLTMYYFKDEQHQDPTVKVSAILEMNKQLGTPDSLKVAVAIPHAGGHVLGSHLVSKDIASVEKEAEKFATEKLHLIKHSSMITDKIENAELYKNLSPLFNKAFKYIAETDFTKLAPGKYPIDGDDVFALLQEYETKPLEECMLEGHKKYADIQYILNGEEQVGITLFNNQQILKPYDVTNDIAFYKGDYSTITLSAGNFSIFFPDDLHMPRVQVDRPSPVRKLVIKVRVGK
jgi:YhcH/YjgK/YiaL family protein